MSQMILEYDEICMFLLNIEVFNIMTQNWPELLLLWQTLRNLIKKYRSPD
jgi:hypothetical protein